MTQRHLPRAAARRAARARAIALGGAAAAAAAGFAAVAVATATRRTASVDRALLGRAGLPEAHPVRRTANHRAVADLGKWWGYLPVALGVAAAAAAAPARRGRRRPTAGAAAVVAAGAVAALLTERLDGWLPQPPAPPARKNPRTPVFPSGHTLGPTAVGTAAAYLLARERLAGPVGVAAAALGFPAVGAVGRLVAGRHWASDVLGGWLAGVAVAAACLAAAELAEGRGRRARGGIRSH